MKDNKKNAYRTELEGLSVEAQINLSLNHIKETADSVGNAMKYRSTYSTNTFDDVDILLLEMEDYIWCIRESLDSATPPKKSSKFASFLSKAFIIFCIVVVLYRIVSNFL